MPRFQKPAEGTWTGHYPELGTGPVSFEDSVSPAFYEVEREAIFRRAWLNVGRVEQLPRSGSYFTKTLPGLRASLIVARAMDGARPRLPQRLPPPRQQARLGRYAPRRHARQRSPVRLQVPRLALRPRRGLHLRAPGGPVLRPAQGGAPPRARALRDLGRLHLRESRPRAAAGRCATSSDRWSERSKAIPSTR